MNKAAVLRLIRGKAKELEFRSPEFAGVLDTIADQIEEMPDETAQREKVYTPIHKASPIAYPSWKCSHCGFEDRYRKGSYCKMCGRRFDER